MKNISLNEETENYWDDFFLSENTVSEDFMAEREVAYQAERESL